MTPIAILPILAFAIILIVWSYILGQRKRDPVNRAFLLFSGVAGGWLGIHLLLYIPNLWPYYRVLYTLQAFCWIPSGFLFLNFTYILVGRKRDVFYHINLALTLFSMFLHLDFDRFITHIETLDWGIVQIYRRTVDGGFYMPVTLLMVLHAASSLYLIYKKHRHSDDQNERRILRLILAGGIITILASFSVNVTIPLFLKMPHYPRYGSSMVVILLFVIFLAVRKYQFLSMSVESVANELFDDINDGVLLVDNRNLIERDNLASRNLLDRSVIGLTIEDALPGFDARIKDDQAIVIETRHGRRYIDVSLSHSSRSGIQIGKIVILRDITRQKEAEAILQCSRDELEKEVEVRTAELRHAQRMEAIGTFTGAIAHDFNNFLAAILGFANAARNELPTNSPAYADLLEVVTAGRRAKEIIRKLLTFSRADQDAVFQALSIKEVLNEAVALARVSLPSNIETQFDTDRCDSVVNCDPVQLTQLFMNLSANAFHALRDTEHGLFSISAKSTVVDESLARMTPPLKPGVHAKIVVRDNGHGMDPQTQERIFDPFFTTKPIGEGTGLGLSTSIGIVRAHGGAMTVQSAPNNGCVFTIYLPTIERKPVSLSDSTPRRQGSGNERLLVVDDEQQMGRLLVRQLTPLGYQVTTESSSRSALERIRHNPVEFDLILSDYTMPELSGLLLTKEIRQISHSIPIILMSGYGDELDRKELKNLRVHSLLQKPVSVGDLSNAIRAALALR